MLAGYPWLGVSTRDALVSLTGCYLVQGLFEEAKDVLRGVASHRIDELLASHWAEASNPAPLPSLDGSLWLFEAVRSLLEFCPAALPFALQEMYPVLRGIYQRILRTPRDRVWLTSDGLLAGHSETEPLTWMDSRSRGEAVTPRHGLAVELQALWSRGLETLATLAEAAQDSAFGGELRLRREQAKEAFRRRFWCNAAQYPYDCIDDVTGAADSAIRPNAVLCLALDPSLLEAWQAKHVVEHARQRLLTVRGLRTLEPTNPAYVGYYEGGMELRRAAYHQGVVWGYLIGALARAALANQPNDFELQMDVRDWVLRVIENGPVLNQVAQVAAGDAPHQAGGCPAQAWSVAEALRTLVHDLGL
jgi:predicted glycogen debranching enzyme